MKFSPRFVPSFVLTCTLSALASPSGAAAVQQILGGSSLGGTASETVVAETCDVLRNNVPHHYVSGVVDPNTGDNYSHEVFQPPGFDAVTPSDAGVAAGAASWRWIPAALNMRRSTRQVSGFYAYLYPSASTQVFPFDGSIPEWSMVPTRLRADGGHEPDPTQPSLLTIERKPFVFASPGAKRARVAFSVPVPIDGVDDVCLQFRWEGGEHRLRPETQSLVGTAGEAPWKVPTWGYREPASVGGEPVAVDTFQDPLFFRHTTLWMSYYEAEPSIIAESTYAFGRVPSLVPPNFSGTCDAAGLADLGSTVMQIGWNVDAGRANAGSLCIPMFNLSADIHGVGSQVAGVTTLEIDPAHPLLGFFSGLGYFGIADADGYYAGGGGIRTTLAPLGPAAVGWYLGMEYLVLDPLSYEIRGTTQAHWTEIIQ